MLSRRARDDLASAVLNARPGAVAAYSPPHSPSRPRRVRRTAEEILRNDEGDHPSDIAAASPAARPRRRRSVATILSEGQGGSTAAARARGDQSTEEGTPTAPGGSGFSVATTAPRGADFLRADLLRADLLLAAPALTEMRDEDDAQWRLPAGKSPSSRLPSTGRFGRRSRERSWPAAAAPPPLASAAPEAGTTRALPPSPSPKTPKTPKTPSGTLKRRRARFSFGSAEAEGGGGGGGLYELGPAPVMGNREGGAVAAMPAHALAPPQVQPQQPPPRRAPRPVLPSVLPLLVPPRRGALATRGGAARAAAEREPFCAADSWHHTLSTIMQRASPAAESWNATLASIATRHQLLHSKPALAAAATPGRDWPPADARM